MIGIATAARTAGAAVLVGATALGLTMGTAHAAPGAPDPPSGEGTLYGDPAATARSGVSSNMTTTACRWRSPTWLVN
ncbi:MAG TPA: hypothetical protein VNY55_09435 [Mycobacterium sp.]|nr:hypothetical protein [Mycobacterium sp.]